MPTPLVHALLPAACLAVTYPSLPALSRRQWLKLLFLAMVLANSPDFDLIPVMFAPSLWQTFHRYYGHNLFAVTTFILLGGWAMRRWVAPQFSRGQAYGIAAALVLSHLFLDSMSVIPPELSAVQPDRGKLPLLFPFTKAQWRLPWGIFPGYRTDSTQHPALAYALASDYWGRVFFLEARAFLTMLLVFAGVWHLPRLFGRFRKARVSSGSAPRRPSATAPTSAP